ncbi:MAG: exodeoxyribonuclease III [Endomicrobium sp.]|jgi:exodeoxyribonuclease-3|nr:exodeoxyribonuclease III [Endomicrobium sp.]
MKIISWNVNGVRAVYKKDFAKWFKSENADIVCLQETKAEKEQFPKELAEAEGYNFYCSCAQKKGYSGVAAWSKIKPLSIETSIENEKFDSEGRVLKLEFDNFVLFNIYFPNGGASKERLDYKLDFYDYFIKYLRKYGKKNVIICGDYNTAHHEIDLARPKQNEGVSGFMPIERKKLDDLEQSGFVDSFRHFNREAENYTWWDYKTAARTRNVGWRIDYFYVSKSALKYLKMADILSSVQGSDHCPISITIF